MAHPKFKDSGESLGQLIEECGEVLSAAGKAVRFGIDSCNPLPTATNRETNREWLLRELTDLEYAIRRVRETYG